MSDIFNHEADAWDSYEDDDGTRSCADPLYHHDLIRFSHMLNETEKAYLLQVGEHRLWIPKKICRHFLLRRKSVWVHRITYDKIVDAAELKLKPLSI